MIGATPKDDNDGHGGDVAGAAPANPRLSWLRGWGLGKAKRDVGKTVTPNRVTIAGHKFALEAMPSELQTEMFEALFNRTRFEDLAKELVDFEIKADE